MRLLAQLQQVAAPATPKAHHAIFTELEQADLTPADFHRLLGAEWRCGTPEADALTRSGRSLFHDAMKYHRVDAVRYMVSRGLSEDTERTGPDGWCYQRTLACYLRGRLVDLVLPPTRAPVVRPDTLGPLHLALCSKNLEGFMAVFDVDPRTRDEKIAHAVHVAIKKRSKYCLVWLVAKFPEALALLYHGHGPLGTACRQGNARIMSVLLQLGSPPAQANVALYKNGRTALQILRSGSVPAKLYQECKMLLKLYGPPCSTTRAVLMAGGSAESLVHK